MPAACPPRRARARAAPGARPFTDAQVEPPDLAVAGDGLALVGGRGEVLTQVLERKPEHRQVAGLVEQSTVRRESTIVSPARIARTRGR